MNKEYRFLDIGVTKSKFILQNLNDYAKDGWRVVCFVDLPNEEYITHDRYFLLERDATQNS